MGERAQARCFIGRSRQSATHLPNNDLEQDHRPHVVSHDRTEQSDQARSTRIGEPAGTALRRALQERDRGISRQNRLDRALRARRSDAPAGLEGSRSQLDAVRRTFTTTSKPSRWTCPPRGAKRISITVTDTMLLAPAKMQSLERLGAALGLAKIVLPLAIRRTGWTSSSGGNPSSFRVRRSPTPSSRRSGRTACLGPVVDCSAYNNNVPTLASAGVRMICDLMTRSGLG